MATAAMKLLLRPAMVATSTAAVTSKMTMRRGFSSARTAMIPWNLFPTARQVDIVPVQPPQYLADWRHNLEFSLEKMRLTEEPIGMQLLNRNARRPKKVRLSCLVNGWHAASMVTNSFSSFDANRQTTESDLAPTTVDD